MKLYKQFRDVMQDPYGDMIIGGTVTVYYPTGALAPIYGDPFGNSGLITGSTVTSNTRGAYSFYAPDGRYRLVVAAPGYDSVTIDDVVVGSGGDDETGLILLSRYLNASASNGLAAFAAAFDVAANLKASGKFGSIRIDCEGAAIGVPSTLFFSSLLGNTTVANLRLYALAADWTETDTDDIAFFNKYQTVTSEAKTWSLRKPLAELQANNIGLVLERVYLDGKGNETTRQSAGLRVLGNTSDRKIVGGKYTNVESYGLFIGSDTPNSAQIDVDSLEIKPNSSASRLDRTSYGFVLAGNDMHTKSLVVSNCHCPLLVGDTGATTFFSDADFFNGAGFDNTGYPHRLAEYHGNTCTFVGGRLGNGQFHIWNKDIMIGPVKFGITEGSGVPPASYFVMYATKPGDDLNNFVLNISETPYDLKSTISWFSFPAPTGGNSWAVDTTKLASVKGYIQTLASGKTTFQQVNDTEKIATFASCMTGGYLYFEDATTNQSLGVGAVGNALRFRTNDADKWEVLNNGNMRPLVTDSYSLGSNSLQMAGVYSTAFFSGANKVLGARDTGWTAGTGTPNKGAFNAATATTAQCASRILAIEQALFGHGSIGT